LLSATFTAQGAAPQATTSRNSGATALEAESSATQPLQPTFAINSSNNDNISNLAAEGHERVTPQHSADSGNVTINGSSNGVSPSPLGADNAEHIAPPHRRGLGSGSYCHADDNGPNGEDDNGVHRRADGSGPSILVDEPGEPMPFVASRRPSATTHHPHDETPTSGNGGGSAGGGGGGAQLNDIRIDRRDTWQEGSTTTTAVSSSSHVALPPTHVRQSAPPAVMRRMAHTARAGATLGKDMATGEATEDDVRWQRVAMSVRYAPRTSPLRPPPPPPHARVDT
jgi:hypothetical protein